MSLGLELQSFFANVAFWFVCPAFKKIDEWKGLVNIYLFNSKGFVLHYLKSWKP